MHFQNVEEFFSEAACADTSQLHRRQKCAVHCDSVHSYVTPAPSASVRVVVNPVPCDSVSYLHVPPECGQTFVRKHERKRTGSCISMLSAITTPPRDSPHSPYNAVHDDVKL